MIDKTFSDAAQHTASVQGLELPQAWFPHISPISVIFWCICASGFGTGGLPVALRSRIPEWTDCE